MRRILCFILAAFAAFSLSACNDTAPDLPAQSEESYTSYEILDKSDTDSELSQSADSLEPNDDENGDVNMTIKVNGQVLEASLADTAAASELLALVQKEPVTLTLSEYGGFEKVGALPQSFTKSDEQTSAQPGDIMLYQGDKMTIFYGSNQWSYTHLGRIEDVKQSELADIFGEGDVTVILSASK